MSSKRYRAKRSFICPKTARDWKRIAADRADPAIVRHTIEAGDEVTPPCEAALESWLANDLVEEVKHGRTP